MTLVDASTKWLDSLPYPTTWGLVSMQNILRASKLDLSKLSVVHVTGTNGKGSVCAMIETIARTAGEKTGLYTSPHLVDVTERMRINGKNISPKKLAGLVAWAKPLQEKTKATMFEVVTLIAFKYFIDEKVDIAVIEVGLGGSFDATNVFEKSVPVITSISFDHMDYLGPTLESIGKEKAAIIKGQPAIIGCRGVAEKICAEQSSLPIIPALPTEITTSWKGTRFVYKKKKFELGLIGVHQAHNAAIAIETARFLGFSDAHIAKGLKHTRWAGRFELISHRPRVVMDGAHNVDAVRVLVATLQALKWKPHVLFAVMKDKEYTLMLRTLAPHVKGFTFTQIEQERCAKAVDLVSLVPRARAEPDLEKALSLVKNEPNLLITGSLYMLGEVKKLTKKE